jgi:hypothetical protein
VDIVTTGTGQITQYNVTMTLGTPGKGGPGGAGGVVGAVGLIGGTGKLRAY